MIGSISSGSTGSIDFSAVRQQMEAKLFSKVDKDGSGTISKDEFTSFQADMAARTGDATGTSATSAEDLFTEADTDADGVLSQDEFSAFGEKMRAQIGGMGGAPPMGPPPGSAETSDSSSSSSTDPADSNGDGTVSAQELLTYYQQVSAKLEKYLQQLVSDSDSSFELTA